MGWGSFQSRRPVNWLLDRPIAHRGLHNLAAGIPENTIGAFDAAIRAALPIEFDVRLTEDHQAVVFHDGNLRRLTGVNQSVASTTLRDMQRLTISGTGERPPSLHEALEFIDGRVPVLIEVKAGRPPGGLESEVRKAIEGYQGLSAVQSFSPKSMRWFRSNAPEMIRGQISGSYHIYDLSSWHRFMHKHLLMLRISRPDFIAHHVGSLGLPASRLWRRLGGPLLAWTVRSMRDLDRARLRADGVIFEGFDLLKPALTARSGLATS